MYATIPLRAEPKLIFGSWLGSLPTLYSVSAFESINCAPLNPQIVRQWECPESFGISDKSAKAKQASHLRSKQHSHCGANVIIQENIMAQPHNHLYCVAQHDTEGTSILLEILTVAAMLLRMKYNDRDELRHIRRRFC